MEGGWEESLIFPASFFPCPSTKRTRIRRRARRRGVSAGGSPRARGRGDAASRGGGAAHGERAASPQPPFPQQAQAAAGARRLLGQAVPHPPRADGIAYGSCIPLCWGRGFSLPTTPPPGWGGVGTPPSQLWGPGVGGGGGGVSFCSQVGRWGTVAAGPGLAEACGVARGAPRQSGDAALAPEQVRAGGK